MLNAAPNFGPGGFPMPTAEEMQEVEKMFADPEFQKMFEGIMNDIQNDPSSLDFLNPNPPAPTKGLTQTLDVNASQKTPVTETSPEEPFVASDNWRENFLHDFDAEKGIPSTDAKGSRENDELSLFKKKLPEGDKKVKVKIPTSLKNAYATFCYHLSTAVVKLKHIVASDTLGAHGRDKLRHTFGDAASLLLTNAFKILSKTLYIREFYLSSLETRKKALGILDEIERIATSIAIRDEETDDFETIGADAFKEHQKNIKKIEALMGSMKTITANFAKALDMSQEGLEKKRKEREERAKKQAERPQNRDTRQRFGGSSSSSGWGDYPSYNSRGKNAGWGGNTWGGGSGNYDWMPSGSGSNYWDDGYHPHETPKQPEAPTVQKPAENNNFYNGTKGAEALSEAQKTFNVAKMNLMRALKDSVVAKLEKYVNADPMNANINKFYLETDSPALFSQYATKLKALASDVQTIDLIAQGLFESERESLESLTETSKKAAQVPGTKNDEARKKEAAELLKKWQTHIQKVYKATTNLALQAVKFPLPDRSAGTTIVLPLLGKPEPVIDDEKIIIRVNNLYKGIEELRASAKPYQPEGLALTIDEKREEAIMSNIKAHIAEAKKRIEAVRIAKDAWSAAGVGTAALLATYKKAEEDLFSYQKTILHDHITPFTRKQLAEQMWQLYNDDAKRGPDYLARQVISRIYPNPLTRGTGPREIDYENKDEAQIATDAFFWFGNQTQNTSPKKNRRDDDRESGDESRLGRIGRRRASTTESDDDGGSFGLGSLMNGLGPEENGDDAQSTDDRGSLGSIGDVF